VRPSVKIKKAVITAAGRDHARLPLQMLVDSDGVEKPAIRIIIEEAAGAGIEEAGLVIRPEDQAAYAAALEHAPLKVAFVFQEQARGYGHALLCARDFTGEGAFLHCVSDHVFLSSRAESCVQQLIQVAAEEKASVTAVRRTRESLLRYYGTYGAKPLPSRERLYAVEKFLEKPNITIAEQELLVPGLRPGFYLCSFGMHVFTSGIMKILGQLQAAEPAQPLALTPALQKLAAQERYLACEIDGDRHNLGQKYGFLISQMALGLAGPDREELLTMMLELAAAQGQPGSPAGATR